MRALLVAVLTLLVSACATERLKVTPPAGVDFSGSWKLNEADSDDPQHLLNPQKKNQDPNDPSQARGRGQGRRGGGGGPAGGPGMAGGVSQGPPPPGAAQMRMPLRFPGKQLEIKQVAGVVSFSSDGRSRVCQPGTERKKAAKPDYRDRDPSPMSRDNASPVCGWEEATLVLMGGEENDDHDRPQFEEQYTLSTDRQRLVETVVFRGGRSSGFTMSRVWDRGP